MATVTTASTAELTSAARIVPRWLPNDRCSLRGRRAQRTARRDTATAATSVRLWPASASRPEECATAPATTCTTTSTALMTSTVASLALARHGPTLSQPRTRAGPGARPGRPGGRCPPARAPSRRDGSRRCTGHRSGARGTGRGGPSGASASSCVATTSGSRTSASSDADARAIAACRVSHIAGVEPPEIHRHQRRRRPARSDRVRPCSRTGRLPAATTCRRSSRPTSNPSSSTWQMPRVTGESPTTALLEPEPDERVVGRAAREVCGQHRRGQARRRGRRRWRRRRARRSRARGPLRAPRARCPAGHSCSAKPRPRWWARCARRGSGWPDPWRAPCTSTMRSKPAVEGIAGHQVDDRFASGSDGGQRLAPAVATRPPGGQDHERRGRRSARSPAPAQHGARPGHAARRNPSAGGGRPAAPGRSRMA